MQQQYRIPDLMPYVNWSYFYFAWGVKAEQPEACEVRAEAERLMHHLSLNGVVVRAAFRLFGAYNDGDDVVLTHPVLSTFEGDTAPRSCDNDGPPLGRLSFLRQQHDRQGEPSLCLSDFIAPQDYTDPTHCADHIGLFATSVSVRHECPCCVGDVLLLQTVKDRLAEAAAEVLHAQVRRSLWGYCPDEPAPLPNSPEFTAYLEYLFHERFQGIRPAVGYPSLPDQSFIFQLAQYLPFAELGITLTDNGMMQPHASTCGLVLAHPATRYFSIGPVADDQLADYACRRDVSPQYLRKFLPHC